MYSLTSLAITSLIASQNPAGKLSTRRSSAAAVLTPPMPGGARVNAVNGSSSRGTDIFKSLARFTALLPWLSGAIPSITNCCCCSLARRFSVEFQWFLTALSVRPGSNRAMVAHRFPNRAWAAKIVSSSVGENGRCSTFGLNWLHHLSRHDFPDRPLM